MVFRKVFCVRSIVLSSLLALLLIGGSPLFAQDECVTHAGVEHCALGGAVLDLTEEGLDLYELHNADEDGVSVATEGAIGWRSDVQLSAAGEGALRLGAVANGKEVSTATIKTTTEGISFSSTFTGGGPDTTYSVKVYRGGVFQGGQGGISTNRLIIGYNISIDEYMDWLQWLSFYLRMADGSCSWEFQGNAEQPLAIRLPNGDEVLGDEIRLVEEVRGAGNYPYVDFDGITLRAQADAGRVGNNVVVIWP